MKDIKQELQNLFTGEIYDKETNNLEDIQIDKISIDILKNDNDKVNIWINLIIIIKMIKKLFYK